jgi:hypothetical protein
VVYTIQLVTAFETKQHLNPVYLRLSPLLASWFSMWGKDWGSKVNNLKTHHKNQSLGTTSLHQQSFLTENSKGDPAVQNFIKISNNLQTKVIEYSGLWET